MKYKIVVACIAVGYLSCLHPLRSAYAQTPCDPSSIQQKEHEWHKITSSGVYLKGAELSSVRSWVDKLGSVVTAQYPHPKGVEGRWYGDHGYINPGAFSGHVTGWGANFTIFPYQCIQGMEKVGNGYTGSLLITVNTLGWLGNTTRLNGKDWITVKAALQERDGYYYYNGANAMDKQTQEIWLITRDGKLPFHQVTRKEYLAEAKAEQQKMMEEEVAARQRERKIRPQAEQDADKQKQVDYAKKNYTGAALDRQLVWIDKNYKSDQQLLEESIAQTRKSHQDVIDKLDAEARMGDDYLSKPAVIPMYTGSFNGFAQAEKDYLNSTNLIRPDSAYFDKDAGRTAPQFICVNLRHYKDIPADQPFYFAYADKAFLDKLHALIPVKKSKTDKK